MCKCTQVINKLPLEFAAVILLCVILLCVEISVCRFSYRCDFYV